MECAAGAAHLEQDLLRPLLQNLLTVHAGHEGEHDLRLVGLDQWRNGKAAGEERQCPDFPATPLRRVGSEMPLDDPPAFHRGGVGVAVAQPFRFSGRACHRSRLRPRPTAR